jgi:hypothetical protein
MGQKISGTKCAIFWQISKDRCQSIETSGLGFDIQRVAAFAEETAWEMDATISGLSKELL